MPNHFTVTIDQQVYPCEYDVDTNTLKAELPTSNPLDQSQVVTIQQRSGNTLHQQIWSNAMLHLNAEGVFEIPAPPTPTGASSISDGELADMVGDISDEFAAPHPVLSGPSPLNAPSVLKQVIDAPTLSKYANDAATQYESDRVSTIGVAEPTVTHDAVKQTQLLHEARHKISLLQAELSTLEAPPKTSPDTVIAVQRVIINQMHSLYAVAVEDDEKMLAVMQRLLDDGEAVYNEWRGDNGNA